LSAPSTRRKTRNEKMPDKRELNGCVRLGRNWLTGWSINIGRKAKHEEDRDSESDIVFRRSARTGVCSIGPGGKRLHTISRSGSVAAGASGNRCRDGLRGRVLHHCGGTDAGGGRR